MSDSGAPESVFERLIGAPGTLRPDVRAGVRALAAAAPSFPSLASVFVVIAALLVWAGSLAAVDLNAMNDLGLVSVLPKAMLAALLLVTTSFCICLHRRELSEPLLALHLLALVVMLYAIPPLVEEVPRFAVTWRHIGVAEAISRTHEVDPTIDAYFNWPGFFALSAFATNVSGLDATSLAAWTPVALNVLYLGPLLLLLREVTDDRRVVWLGLLIFYLANWIGQDYFSPQGLNYFLYLVILLIVVRWFRRTGRSQVSVWIAQLVRRLPAARALEPGTAGRGAAVDSGASGAQRAALMAILLGLFGTTVASHQLTPFAVLLAVTALVVFDRCSSARLPLVMMVLIGTWSAFLAVAYFKGHLASLTGNVGALEQNVGTSVGGRLHGSVEHLLVLYARLAITGGVWSLAFLGAIRAYRRRRFSGTFALLACAPFALMALQPYGGEILLRTYLFSLPFIAFFAACFFYVALDTGRSWITTGLACLAVGVLGLGFLVTRYGNERMDYFTPAELSAVRYVTETARPGSLLLSAASSLPWKLEKYEQFHYKTLDASPVWLSLDPEHPDVAALVREVERELKRPTGGYFLLTRSQEAQLEMLGWRRSFLERFEQGLQGSEELRIAYANRDASVFVVNPQKRRHKQVSR